MEASLLGASFLYTRFFFNIYRCVGSICDTVFFKLGVPFGRAFRYNLFFVPPKRISTTNPYASFLIYYTLCCEAVCAPFGQNQN